MVVAFTAFIIVSMSIQRLQNTKSYLILDNEDRHTGLLHIIPQACYCNVEIRSDNLDFIKWEPNMLSF